MACQAMPGARRRAPLILAALLMTLGAASAARAQSPAGLWMLENGDGVVAIERCGGEFCGRIVGVAPDVAQRIADEVGRGLCGRVVLEGFAPAAAGRWDGGTIHNPFDGRSYQGRFTLEHRDELALRVYVGNPVFGDTLRLRRVTELGQVVAADWCREATSDAALLQAAGLVAETAPETLAAR